MLVYRVAFVAAVLTLGACSAQASSVTYDFYASTGNPSVPGSLVASLTFSSPATASAAWSTSTSSTITSFQILNAGFGSVGTYAAKITSSHVASTTGAGLNYGAISGTLGVATITASFSSSPYESVLTTSPRNHSVRGTWQVVAAAVPEPSSIVLSGTAVMAGMVLCARRRVKPCQSSAHQDR